VNVGGQAVLTVRAERFVVQGNRFGTGFTESIDARAGSGAVVQNYLRRDRQHRRLRHLPGGARDLLGNREPSARRGIPGITASGFVSLPVPNGVEPLAIPATAETWAVIRNNEVRDHLRTPVGVGIRVEAVGTGAPNVHNTIHAIIQDNLVANNRFGFIVHGGFPVAGTDRTSNVDVTYGGNTIQQSCQAKLLVALSRHQTVLGLNGLSVPSQLDLSDRARRGSELERGLVWPRRRLRQHAHRGRSDDREREKSVLQRVGLPGALTGVDSASL